MSKSVVKNSNESSLSSRCANTKKRRLSILERYTGIRPLIPRGQLDIGWTDLGFAAFASISLWKRTDMRHFCQLEKEIETFYQQQAHHGNESSKNTNTHNDSGVIASSSFTRPTRQQQQRAKKENEETPKRKQESVVVGLAVRSLLDLYLTSRSYPSGSHVIVVPPINIPDIIQVLLYHNLKIVTIDLPSSSSSRNSDNDDGIAMIGIDLQALERVLQQQQQTVAILVVHPFGMVMSRKETNGVVGLAATYGVDVIEDCAECFNGMHPQDQQHEQYHHSHLGFSGADISLFSFGTIKTATALGGGIAVVRNEKIAREMKRIQHNVFGMQSRQEYLWKVVKCAFVYGVAQIPSLCGLVLFIIQCLGMEYDQLVSCLTRGFASRKTPMRQERRNAKAVSTNDTFQHEQNEQRRELMVQIRKRPAPALLSLLLRRLKQRASHKKVVEDRIKRCEFMTSLLKEHVPEKHLAIPSPLSSCADHLYWLYPVQILACDRSQVSQKLLRHGYDVPAGTSQLACVSRMLHMNDNNLSGSTECCPRAGKMMDEILYLPNASHPTSNIEMTRLAKTIASAITEATNNTQSIPNKQCHSCGGLTEIPLSRTSSPWVKMLYHHELWLMVIVLLVDAWVFHFLPGTHLSLKFLQWSLRIVFGVFLPLYLASLFIAHIITCCTSDVYLNSTLDFAQYNGLLKKSDGKGNGPNCQTQDDDASVIRPQFDPIKEMDALKLPADISNDNKSHSMALLTGATGFLGSLLLRDLLLHRNELGIPGGVAVLCRANRNMTPEERIRKLLSDPMYSFLSQEEKTKLVTVIQGDVTIPLVGMSREDAHRVFHQMDISHVFHCAASVRFTQTLEDAAKSNITPSLLMQALTKKLKSKNPKYIYISTAFVHGARTGTREEPLPEQVFPLDEYDAVKIYRSMLETQAYASAAMTDLKFHNTYAFSKCVCEHLLLRDSSVNTIIVRPSIVGPAVQSPYEGWAGEKPSTLIAAACLYLSYHWNLWCFGKTPMAVVPVDVVSRCILQRLLISVGDK